MALEVLAAALEAFMVLVVLVGRADLEGRQVTFPALEVEGFMVRAGMMLFDIPAVEAVAVEVTVLMGLRGLQAGAAVVLAVQPPVEKAVITALMLLEVRPH
jgi:hypothetical protein